MAKASNIAPIPGVRSSITVRRGGVQTSPDRSNRRPGQPITNPVPVFSPLPPGSPRRAWQEIGDGMVLEELDEQRQREWEQSLQDALVIDWQREAEMQGWDTDAAIAEFQRRTEAVRADAGGRIRRIIDKAVRTMESGNKPRFWRMTLAGRG